ncbi:retrovirus-related pol polyprotein from transposon TNT 1-94 [Tanacetum coccineum]
MSNSNTNLQTQSSNALHNAIMEAGSKDRPPMLAPGNYVQWKSRIKRYIDTKPNRELIHYSLQNPPYIYQWAEKTVPVAEGSSETTTERYMENYKNVSQDIRDQMNAEAEAVQIILTGIDNDIYSTVDACPNACEMWKAIERLKQGESINVQDLETNLYWEFGKFTSRYGQLPVLTSTTTRMAKNQHVLANPLALFAQQQPVYHHQNHPTQNTQYSSTRSQQSTRNRGKALVTSSAPTYDPEPATVTEDEEMSKEKAIENSCLISLSRAINVAGARENVGTPVVQKSGIQCYNCKEYGHVSRECQKPKRLNAEQADWKDDTDDESDDQELEAHYMYMAQLQEVTPDPVDNSGPIFDDEPTHKKLKCEIDDSKNRNKFLESSNKELVNKLKGEIEDFKTKNKSLESSNNHFKEANNELSKTNQLMFKDLKKFQAELDKYNDVNYASKVEIDCAKAKGDLIQELDKVIALENKVKVLDDIVYKTGQSVQTMNMLNRNCKTSFAKHEFLKKAQRANPRLYDIGCYNDNLALMLAPDSDENDSNTLKSNWKHKKTQFLNEIDRLSREYYYADHMNAILGIYTDLDEFTDLQCDYGETLEKCERLEKELSKSRTMSKSFESLQKHAINLELDLQQCKEKIKNDKSFKENQSNVFLKEREQYFEIQDLKAQLQDKGIAISELKKLIEKMKGKSVETKFEKSSVIRQPNAFKSQRQSILGKPAIFSDSLAKKDFSKSKPVTTQNVSNDFSKPVTAQILPQNKLPIVRNTNVIAPGMYKVHTKPNHTRTPQLHQDIRKPNKRVSFSTGVIPNTSVSRPQLKSNHLEDRCVLNDNHDLCVLHYINGVNSRTRQQCSAVSTREPKHNVNQSVVTSSKKTVATDSTVKKSRNITRKLYEQLVEIILFIVDSGCSKHMTGNLKLLTNFVEKFMGTVKFGNDQIAPILGYGDLVQGTITIKRVYYVEGLNHNLFSVGQFCDADLEVAFRKSTCYIRDLKGNDLLTGSRGTDLYSISLQDSTTPNPICLMAKATSS